MDLNPHYGFVVRIFLLFSIVRTAYLWYNVR